MTKRRLLYNLLVDANTDRQHTLPSILLRVTGRHRQERSELLQHDRARHRGARRLDYRHQGVRREVTGPSRRRRRRTNHQQLRLVHRKQARGRPDAHTDTMVVGPSAPTVMANTLPSSSPLPMNRCPRGCTGTRTMHQAGMPYWNVNTGMEWDAWRCTRSSRGGPVKLQPVLMASVQPHGPCGHAI